MKHQATMVIEKITKHVASHPILKIGKIFMFLALFCISSMKAQTPIVTDFPAISLGQTMLISTTDPLWDDAMEESGITRAHAQDYINSTTTWEPTEYISCNDQCCCYTKGEYINGVLTYTTVCWKRNGDYLSTHITF